jgi:hypothetical protein
VIAQIVGDNPQDELIAVDPNNFDRSSRMEVNTTRTDITKTRSNYPSANILLTIRPFQRPWISIIESG